LSSGPWEPGQRHSREVMSAAVRAMPGAGREIPGLVVTRGTGADRATMGDRLEVLVDSGFRCGSGIAAALTLGAGPCWPGARSCTGWPLRTGPTYGTASTSWPGSCA